MPLFGRWREDRDLQRKAAVFVASLMREPKDQNVDASTLDIAERQFNARISAYRDGLDSRSSGIPVATRLGQTLFAFAGGAFRDAGADVVRGGELLVAYAAEANDTLRKAFGVAQLPENIPPSEIANR
jgi:hypothetical protein